MSSNISIIIPCYNLQDYIVKAIASLPLKEVEVIVVNDCSTDDSIAIAKQAFGDAITIIEHSQNKGLSATRNTGLKHASGEYVLFLDGDDYLAPNAINIILDELQRSPQPIDVLAFGSQMVDEQGKTWTNQWMNQYAGKNLELINAQSPLSHTLIGWDVAAWSKVIRREFLLTHHITFDEEQRWFEDHLFSAQVYAKAQWINYIDTPLHYYLQRSANASQKSITQEKGRKVAYYRARAIYQVATWLKEHQHQQQFKLHLPLFLEQLKPLLMELDGDKSYFPTVYQWLHQAFNYYPLTWYQEFGLVHVDLVYLIRALNWSEFHQQFKNLRNIKPEQLKPYLHGNHKAQFERYQQHSKWLYRAKKPILWLTQLPYLIRFKPSALTMPPKKLALRLRDLDLLKYSQYFDQPHYQQQTGKTFSCLSAAIVDYLDNGEKQNLSPMPQFSPQRYLQLNPDLQKINMSLFSHYLLYASIENRPN